MSKINRIKVMIDDTLYELTSHESPDYIKNVAAYMDKKIKNIYSIKSEASINPKLKTLFISLNIADDLFKEKERNRELELELRFTKERLSKIEEQLEKIQEHNIKLNKENDSLKVELKSSKQELEKSRLELEEFIIAFEAEEKLRSIR